MTSSAPGRCLLLFVWESEIPMTNRGGDHRVAFCHGNDCFHGAHMRALGARCKAFIPLCIWSFPYGCAYGVDPSVMKEFSLVSGGGFYPLLVRVHFLCVLV
ncbi:hypothetical protein KP509_10G039200 [Ceratopteris richardii]|uniref:Uncharacterized protein n=1 Tax=Ceratopteris richardii TaxID=49495 RepID=A0A8T2U134_CERRI|nr:hypothetical protein KP509_10G039200 [Ceratopteris richardii]